MEVLPALEIIKSPEQKKVLSIDRQDIMWLKLFWGQIIYFFIKSVNSRKISCSPYVFSKNLRQFFDGKKHRQTRLIVIGYRIWNSFWSLVKTCASFQTIFFRRYLSSLFCLVLVLCSTNSYQLLSFF